MTKTALLVNDYADCGKHYNELFEGLGYDIDHLFEDECYFDITSKVKKADLVVFTGGSDISPEYYGQDHLPRTYCDPARDQFEKVVFEYAYMKNKHIVGICRGLQFINVMLGGTLHQHIDKHGNREHCLTPFDGKEYCVNSFHHQAVNKIGCPQFLDFVIRSQFDESIEAVVWSDKVFGVQWHPELGGEGEELFKKLYDDVFRCYI